MEESAPAERVISGYCEMNGAQEAESLLSKKVCMLGSYAVGKTSLVRRYVEGVFSEQYLTTVGVKIDRKCVTVGKTELHLVLWDLFGDDDVRQPKPSHFRGTAGYILVVDGCRRMTAEKASAIQERAVSISGPAPVVVALNKADLEEQWEIESEDVQKLGENQRICIRTSAKTGEGVEELFRILAEKMLDESNDSFRK